MNPSIINLKLNSQKQRLSFIFDGKGISRQLEAD